MYAGKEVQMYAGKEVQMYVDNFYPVVQPWISHKTALRRPCKARTAALAISTL